MSRGKFSFWLDFRKDDELLVAEAIDELKAHRSFSSVIRDGIMIVRELKQGRVDLLLKLYPFVKDAIIELAPPTPPQSPPFDMEGLLRKFEAMIAERGSIPDSREGGFPLMSPAMKPSKLQKAIALPIIEPDIDDTDTIVLTKSAARHNGGNLLAGILGLD